MGRGKKFLILSVLSLFLAGCATTGTFIPLSSRSSPPPDLGISSENKELNVSITTLIIPSGQGSWIKAAPWDEYVLTIKNLSDKPLTVEKIQLIDPRGSYIDGGLSITEIEKMTATLANEYKKIGISVAITYAPPLLFLATSSMGILALGPLSLIAGPAYYFGKTWYETENKKKIEEEFNRRALPNIFIMSANENISGSEFFPIVPNPKTLIINYQIEKQPMVFELSLEKLAGLHVAPAGEEKK